MIDADFITMSKAIQRCIPTVEGVLTSLINSIEENLEVVYQSDASKAVDYEVRLNAVLAGLYVALEKMERGG